MNEAWPKVPLGQLLRKCQNWINILPDITYREVTVRLWGKGVVERRSVLGAQIKSDRRLRVKPGQFILSRIDARNGAFGMIPEELDGAVVSNDFPVFDPVIECLFVPYLKWLSRTHDFIEWCKAASEGTTNRVRLKEGRFLATPIPLPPLIEQRRLVVKIERLNREFDAVRVVRKEAIDKTENLLQSELDRLYDFLKDSAGELSLADVCTVITDGTHLTPTFSEQGIRFIFVGNVSSGRLHFQQCKCVEPEYYASLKEIRKPRRGDILYSAVGATLGVPALVDTDIPFCFQRHLALLRPNRDRIHPQFLHHMLRSGRVFNFAWASTTGSAQPTVPLRAIRQISIPLPSIAKQQRISEYLDGLSSKVNALQRLQAESMSHIEALLPSILDRAFRGELSTHDAMHFQLASPDRNPSKIRHSRGIVFKRAAVAAFIINELRDDPFLGRTKLEKLNHLLEYHLGVPLEREPVRDAAGPNDYSALRKVESLAAKQGWFTAKGNEERRGIRYEAGANIQDRIGAGGCLLGDKLDAAKQLIALLRKADAKQIEIIATLYASWNDFLLSGHSPSDPELVIDVRENWHESKKAIPPERWLKAIGWMKEKGLAPKGTGRPVPHKNMLQSKKQGGDK